MFKTMYVLKLYIYIVVYVPGSSAIHFLKCVVQGMCICIPTSYLVYLMGLFFLLIDKYLELWSLTM